MFSTLFSLSGSALSHAFPLHLVCLLFPHDDNNRSRLASLSNRMHFGLADRFLQDNKPSEEDLVSIRRLHVFLLLWTFDDNKCRILFVESYRSLLQCSTEYIYRYFRGHLFMLVLWYIKAINLSVKLNNIIVFYIRFKVVVESKMILI